MMLYALGWFFVVSLLALWSLAAWALHGLTAWSLSSAGALSGSATEAVSLAVPAWLVPWLPPELMPALSQLLTDLAPLVDGLLQAAPALAGGVTVLAWVTWAIGALLLVLLGLGLHLLIALWRRRSGGAAGPGAGRSMAAG